MTFWFFNRERGSRIDHPETEPNRPANPPASTKRAENFSDSSGWAGSDGGPGRIRLHNDLPPRGPKESADGPGRSQRFRAGPSGAKHTHEHRRIGPTRAVDPPGPSGSHVNRPTTRRIGKKRCGGRAPLPGLVPLPPRRRGEGRGGLIKKGPEFMGLVLPIFVAPGLPWRRPLFSARTGFARVSPRTTPSPLSSLRGASLPRRCRSLPRRITFRTPVTDL